MKKLSIFLSAFAALAAVSSCVEEKYQPGEPDVEGCYGVYFPAQEASGSHVYDPAMEASVTFTVARLRTEDYIEVPVTVTVSEEKIFEVGKIEFEDGQKETTLTVRFPEAKEGVEYSLALSIDDPQYVSSYNVAPASLEFSVLRVQMFDLLNPQGEKATVTFYEEWWELWWWCGVHDAHIKYYEVDGIRYCTAYTDDPEEGMWGYGTDLSFTWNTSTNKLDLPENSTGYADDYGEYFVSDWYSISLVMGWYSGTREEYFEEYGYRSYYDPDAGIFYFDVAYYTPLTNYVYSDTPVYDVQGWIDGFTRVDYSISASAGLTSEGKVPVYFNAGADVASVKYAVFEGSLSAGQISTAVSAITGGTAESIGTLDMDSRYVEISLDASGLYTLVAVSYDKAGNMQSSTSLPFTYVASGSESDYEVVLSCGIGSAEKYRGANTDNTLEVYAYGDDIVEARIGVFSALDIISSYEDCEAALMEKDPVGSDVLEAINGDGYSALVSNLTPGTEFYVLVYASNGYADKVFMSENGYFTTGDPLPIYMNFTLDDYDESLTPESEKDFYGTWNLYAVDVMYGTTGLREYIGKAVISDSEWEDALTEDEYGYTYQYITIEGLSGYYKDYWEGTTIEDAATFSLCNDGNLYLASNTSVDGNWIVYNLYYWAPENYWYGWNSLYISGFIPVMDGYYAYIDFGWDEWGYVYNGLGYFMDGGDGYVYSYAKFTDYLLVDPAKDDNGLAPEVLRKKLDSAVRSAIATACRPMSKPASRLAPKQTVKSYGSMKMVETQREPKAVSFSASPVERTAGRPAQQRSVSGPVHR